MGEGNPKIETPPVWGRGPPTPWNPRGQSSKIQNTGKARSCWKQGRLLSVHGKAPAPPSLPRKSGLALWKSRLCFAAPFLKTWQIIISSETSSCLKCVYLEIRISNCESLKRPQNSPRPTPSFCQVRKVKLKYPARQASRLYTWHAFPLESLGVGGLSGVTLPLSPPPPSRAEIPSERWMHVCWLSLRKKPSLQRHS